MSTAVTISIDAMGGDAAPDMVVEGVRMAHERLPHVRYLMYGDAARIEPLLARFPEIRGVCTVHHTEESVSMEAKPSQVLRNGRKSSMWLAVEAVQKGEAAGIVSAGNTGALMAVSKFVLRMLPGIDRPAIAGMFPTVKGETLMLDLGANVDCNSNNLVEFAVMGEVYARAVLGLEKPSIGLLNVGSEDMKGNDAVKAAAAALRDSHLPISFYGFVEGNDICGGTVDVVVTDGFTGNVALKAIEGTAKLTFRFVNDAFRTSTFAK
ncbi:MAG: phosphate acyltransferase PlsX, partial [Patescibacteria group bacterium]